MSRLKCSLSGLPIGCGDECLLVPIFRAPYWDSYGVLGSYTPIYFNGTFDILTIPMWGKYDDYNHIKLDKIEDPTNISVIKSLDEMFQTDTFSKKWLEEKHCVEITDTIKLKPKFEERRKELLESYPFPENVKELSKDELDELVHKSLDSHDKWRRLPYTEIEEYHILYAVIAKSTIDEIKRCYDKPTFFLYKKDQKEKYREMYTREQNHMLPFIDKLIENGTLELMELIKSFYIDTSTHIVPVKYHHNEDERASDVAMYNLYKKFIETNGDVSDRDYKYNCKSLDSYTTKVFYDIFKDVSIKRWHFYLQNRFSNEDLVNGHKTVDKTIYVNEIEDDKYKISVTTKEIISERREPENPNATKSYYSSSRVTSYKDLLKDDELEQLIIKDFRGLRGHIEKIWQEYIETEFDYESGYDGSRTCTKIMKEVEKILNDNHNKFNHLISFKPVRHSIHPDPIYLRTKDLLTEEQSKAVSDYLDSEDIGNEISWTRVTSSDGVHMEYNIDMYPLTIAKIEEIPSLLPYIDKVISNASK